MTAQTTLLQVCVAAAAAAASMPANSRPRSQGASASASGAHRTELMVATLTPEQAVRLSALVDLSISLPASVPDSRGCIEGVVRRADHILTESAPPHILARLSGGGRTHTEPNSTDPADHADSDKEAAFLIGFIFGYFANPYLLLFIQLVVIVLLLLYVGAIGLDI